MRDEVVVIAVVVDAGDPQRVGKVNACHPYGDEPAQEDEGTRTRAPVYSRDTDPMLTVPHGHGTLPPRKEDLGRGSAGTLA